MQITLNKFYMTIQQTTIKNPISCYGIGVHSGERVNLTLKPANKNTGIIFIRTDVKFVDNIIPADFLYVSETTLSTTIQNSSNIKVSTIEHLMAAIWGCGIDNIIVELDGPEVPIMDGSSKPFVFMLECAGIKVLNAPRKFLKVRKEVSVVNGPATCVVEPSNNFNITMEIDFANKLIGYQKFELNNESCFKQEIAGARTFGFLKDVEYLQSKGLAKGASLDNAIGLEEDKILNHDGLRFEDEFVRHKLLDAIGDFKTAGFIVGHFQGSKSGHLVNNMLLRKLISDPNAFEYISL
ncbi:MAG: lpxC [Rickettsiaceae bacterium]|jgi:UDP-3-O-[3-hydroxymyristoyl] N-acetylglucosamine deacetylase|nr:lpxC [Rickettsiaceae bacterium]